MTRRNAERITGLNVRPLGKDKWGAFDGLDAQIAEASNRKETRALTILVDRVYAIRREEAMERDGGRCVRCGSRWQLTAHHRIHRSKGRDDRTSNLETLCMNCHMAEHGRSKAEAYVEV